MKVRIKVEPSCSGHCFYTVQRKVFGLFWMDCYESYFTTLEYALRYAEALEGLYKGVLSTQEAAEELRRKKDNEQK